VSSDNLATVYVGCAYTHVWLQGPT